jgi:hypothetical protein
MVMTDKSPQLRDIFGELIRLQPPRVNASRIAKMEREYEENNGKKR